MWILLPLGTLQRGIHPKATPASSRAAALPESVLLLSTVEPNQDFQKGQGYALSTPAHRLIPFSVYMVDRVLESEIPLLALQTKFQNAPGNCNRFIGTFRSDFSSQQSRSS